MKFDNETAVIVVYREWANYRGVRVFLNPGPPREEGDQSYIIEAKVLDSEDHRGLWIELNTEQHEQDPRILPFRLLVPWHQVIAIVLPEESQSFSKEFRDQIRKQIGFTGSQT
jgi:hypothetical protein